ncbi:hypothetical protein RRG08_067042 [Elysia crispata]|uniref:Uncharacterized protein n=1 Tax=Elysia crispata TaxID=231223 RepID=A0AAE0ZZH8_9GAST|nr:hypothetical protein RRG08_067042 [Elysia crispata]
MWRLQRVWVAGRYLSKSSSSSCGSSSSGSTSSGTCSAEQKRLACALLAKHNSGVLDLAKRHPSGVPDNAYAYNNIKDMCEASKPLGPATRVPHVQVGLPEVLSA